MSATVDNNTSLVPMNLDQLPSVQVGSDADFDAISKSSEFLARLQLFTKGKAINKGLVRPGHYGIPEGEEVTDLGDTIDIIPLARRTKAIDMTDTNAVIAVYDAQSKEFLRIQEQSAEKESHCMYGPSFLVYERETGRFLEYFCGSKSARGEAKKLFPYLPLSQPMIDAAAKNGVNVTGMAPHGPVAVTLKSKLVEKGDWSWHVPVVVKCMTQFNRLPTEEVILREITRFLNVQGDTSTVVQEPEKKSRKR